MKKNDQQIIKIVEMIKIVEKSTKISTKYFLNGKKNHEKS